MVKYTIDEIERKIMTNYQMVKEIEEGEYIEYQRSFDNVLNSKEDNKKENDDENNKLDKELTNYYLEENHI